MKRLGGGLPDKGKVRNYSIGNNHNSEAGVKKKLVLHSFPFFRLLPPLAGQARDQFIPFLASFLSTLLCPFPLGFGLQKGRQRRWNKNKSEGVEGSRTGFNLRSNIPKIKKQRQRKEVRDSITTPVAETEGERTDRSAVAVEKRKRSAVGDRIWTRETFCFFFLFLVPCYQYLSSNVSDFRDTCSPRSLNM